MRRELLDAGILRESIAPELDRAVCVIQVNRDCALKAANAKVKKEELTQQAVLALLPGVEVPKEVKALTKVRK